MATTQALPPNPQASGPQASGPLPNGAPASGAGDDSQRLDALLNRIHALTAAGGDETATQPQPAAAQAVPTQPAASTAQPVAGQSGSTTATFQTGTQRPHPASLPAGVTSSEEAWYPVEPNSFAEAGLTDSEVEDLVLKVLNARSESTGRLVAEQICLPFRLIDPLLQQLKLDQDVAHKGSAMMNDYVYVLTMKGRERAKKLTEQCTYFGSAPVTLRSYTESVTRQTLANQQPTQEDLHKAFADLLIDKKMLGRLGPAINSGRGMFLFGAPGNGKTSIAERVTGAFGKYIWIPRSIGMDGEIMRVFDPSMHEAAPIEETEGLISTQKIDKRWIRIERPTIVVGGELTMDALEVTLNPATNTSEAPLQMKSNCGTLVIDDFGRQRMSTDELLNRWIVPLEKRYDFLNLSSGKKIQVPFDQLIIFSTNLEPRDLVDDAFLRRIPYKIEVHDPSESAFRQLFKIMAPILKVEFDPAALDYLIETHYHPIGRPFRCCQPRDLLLQIRNYCRYVKQPPVMSKENCDFAVENYFAVM